MFKRILAWALILASLFAGGILTAGAASAKPMPPGPVYTSVYIKGVIIGPHTVKLLPGYTAFVGEYLKPVTYFYNAYVPVLFVSGVAANGSTIITGWTFLPLNTHGAIVTFQQVLVP
jgi:hypothetical protein